MNGAQHTFASLFSYWTWRNLTGGSEVDAADPMVEQ